MASKSDLLSTSLRQAGYSLTKPRLAVFKSLENSEPLTMHELIERTPAIDRATVYRVIELFQELGIVKRLQIGWKYKLELSDAFNPHHHHLSCTNCGKTIVIHEDKTIEQLIHQLASSNNFKLTDHQLEIQGLCQNCQKIDPDT